jgi:hypothetical protein
MNALGLGQQSYPSVVVGAQNEALIPGRVPLALAYMGRKDGAASHKH